MNSELDSIVIHQVLHGYEEGHRLLRASTVIPSVVEREMLSLSDGQGTGAPKGFETFITAYPLLSIKMYAFARTWPAPEVKRAGCVWTHTLLINFSDVAKFVSLNNTDALRELHRKPSSTKDLDFYKKNLSLFADKQGRKSSHLNLDAQTARMVLSALYAPSSPHGKSFDAKSEGPRPVFLATSNAEATTDFFCALWLQLWPRLRRKFSFCTGTTSVRYLDEHPLDLQAAPVTAEGTLLRSEPDAKFVSFQTVQSGNFKPFPMVQLDWLQVAHEDLIQPKEALRDFCRYFGASMGSRRSDVAKLFTIHAQLEHLNGPFKDEDLSTEYKLAEFIGTLARQYPRDSRAVALKNEILGHNAPNRWLNVKESSLLLCLCTTRFWRAFKAEDLNLEERAKQLWLHQPDKSSDLLAQLQQDGLNPLADALLAGVGEVLTPETASKLLSRNRNLARVFIAEHPQLSTSPAIWKVEQDLQREILDVLTHCNLSDAQKASIGSALYRSQSDLIIDEAVQHLGPLILVGMLAVWGEDSKAAPTLSEQWYKSLARHPRLVIEWLVEHGMHKEMLHHSISLILVLSPDTPDLLLLNIDFWLLIARTALDRIDEPSRAEVLAFCFALGLDNPGRGWLDLLAATFEGTHQLQLEGRLTFSAVKRLDQRLPPIWHSNWDICGRMRYAIIDRFASITGLETTFLKSIKRQNTFYLVLRTASEMPQGRRYFKDIRKSIKLGNISAVHWQQKMIFDNRDLWEVVGDFLN